MKIEAVLSGKRWNVDISSAIELAIALDFYGEQARAFGLPAAKSYAVEDGGFVGDRRRGGSANCERIEITPHGNGTHTEGIGHITEERIAVGDLVKTPFVPATLLTVSVQKLGDTGESYGGDSDEADHVVSQSALEEARRQLSVDEEFFEAVVIRMDPSTIAFDFLADHTGTNPPYLTEQGVAWLRDIGCDHLLVEFPSVDREADGGRLTNHHRFFGSEVFGSEPDSAAAKESRRRTITEMIQVPETASDGPHMLCLRFPRFVSDAAPSRPIIYPVDSIE